MKLIMMDQEFDKLEGVIESIDGSIGNIDINTIAACEHVGQIEQIICTTKECACTIISVLLYLVLPKMMVVYLVYYVNIFSELQCVNSIHKYDPVATGNSSES